MLVEVGDIVLVLLPSCYIEDDNFWSEILLSDIPKHEIHFSKQTYFGLNATVLTNPSLSRVTNGMHVSDYMAGFGNHNYGCTLEFSLKHLTLLTRSTVLNGRKEGIQVWRRSHDFRNVFLNYSARIKTSRGIQALTNLLYDEIYGDRIQALHMLDCHNRATITA